MKKTWTAPTFEDFSSLSQKKIEIVNDDFCFNVLEPKVLKELSINSKKVEEVKQWISNNYKNNASILLVIGPSGSGKTITIKLIAENEGLSVLEWSNPFNKIASKEDPLEASFNEKDTFMEISEGKKFEDFIFRSSRYPSLFESKNHTVILVKDYPNSFIRTPTLFHNFLEKYKTFGKNCIVFVITDDERLDLNNILFPNEVKKKLGVTVIKFNPVSDTYLKKNLENVYSHCKGDFGTVSSKNIEKIVRNAAGDLRSAMTDLITEMRTGISNSNEKKGKKRKKKSSCEDEIKITYNPLFSRDRGYGFYKKMGRILYPKRITKEPQLGAANFVHNYLELAEDWNISYLGFLHENYLQTCSKLEDAVAAADCFSFCDAFSKFGEMEKHSSVIMVFGLMISNTQPKKCGFLSFKKSFNLNVFNNVQTNFNKSDILNYTSYQRSYALDVAPFANILKFDFDQRIRSLDSNTNNFTGAVSPIEFFTNKKMNKNKDSTDEEDFEIEDFDD